MKQEVKEKKSRPSDLDDSRLTEAFGDDDEIVDKPHARGRKTTLSIAEYKQIEREVAVEEDEEVPFGEKSIGGKILHILLFPLNMIGFLTIPPVELAKLENPLVCFYCLSGPMTFIMLRGSKLAEKFELTFKWLRQKSSGTNSGSMV